MSTSLIEILNAANTAISNAAVSHALQNKVLSKGAIEYILEPYAEKIKRLPFISELKKLSEYELIDLGFYYFDSTKAGENLMAFPLWMSLLIPLDIKLYFVKEGTSNYWTMRGEDRIFALQDRWLDGGFAYTKISPP